MTQHRLQGRTEDEILWFQRRDVIRAAGVWVAGGGLGTAVAQQRSNVVQLVGDALLNGSRLLPGQTIQTGDQIQTGPNSSLIFALGNASFLVRQNSLMKVERGATLSAVSLLRIVTGAVASVWNKGGSRSIITPTLTAGIRGTGVYTEVLPQEDSRTYFCNCYGTVDLASGPSKAVSRADYHQSFWSGPVPNGSGLTPAKAINHTDEELEFLAGLLGQRTAWQIAGRKGNKDGSGTMTY
ncbi:MAG: iron dicitrate transport regulator FecR [Polaromonas sp.]|nr:iron dicitrate transport regulator FecR [Polaromonas sp.]